MVNVPWIVRRVQDIYLGGGDFKDAEDGGTIDVHAYPGRLREGVRARLDIGVDRSQGVIAMERRMVFFDTPNLDITPEDILVEGLDDGNGDITEKPNGMKLVVTNVREYDFTTQCDVKDRE